MFEFILGIKDWFKDKNNVNVYRNNVRERMINAIVKYKDVIDTVYLSSNFFVNEDKIEYFSLKSYLKRNKKILLNVVEDFDFTPYEIFNDNFLQNIIDRVDKEIDMDDDVPFKTMLFDYEDDRRLIIDINAKHNKWLFGGLLPNQYGYVDHIQENFHVFWYEMCSKFTGSRMIGNKNYEEDIKKYPVMDLGKNNCYTCGTETFMIDADTLKAFCTTVCQKKHYINSKVD